MLNLAQELTASGKYTAVMVSVEVDSAFNDQPQIAEESILTAWQDAIEFWLHPELQPTFLKMWAETSSRPGIN